MQRILSGVENFRNQVFPQNVEFYERLAVKKQKPIALFITCADSRINPNLITGTEPGDLFLLRNAGNIVPPHGTVMGGEAATIEYAVEVLEVKNIIICGHSQCGAMDALISGKGIEQLPAVKSWCGHAEATRRIVQQKYSNLPSVEKAIAATEQNVLVQLNNLSTHPCIAARLSTGELQAYGWYYDIATGRVLQYDAMKGEFELLEGNSQAMAMNPMPLRSAAGKA